MSSKLYSRSGVFTWSPRGVEIKVIIDFLRDSRKNAIFQGIIIADFAQFVDLNATSIEQKIDFLASNELFENANLSAGVSVNTNYG